MQSFSAIVKDEVSKIIPSSRHCMISEIAGIISFGGKIDVDYDGQPILKIQTENVSVARKCFTLLKKSFNINSDIVIRQNMIFKKSRTYLVIVRHKSIIEKLLLAIKATKEELVVDAVLLQNTCCKRAFLRGVFLVIGSMSDPQKTYHFEMACLQKIKAEQIKHLMSAFSIEGKRIIRKKYEVVYIKEGSQIVDMLNIMEAHVSLMEFENIRILKEMRNNVNRQVNCETANINKTVSAAMKQVEDIKLIKETTGLSSLSEALQEVALLRLDYPEVSLVELGQLLNPPVGKSGVNHRLRKLSLIANDLRG